MSCGMLSTWLFHIIREEINAKLPQEQRIAPLGATPFTFAGVRRMHRGMYPQSNLRLITYGVICVGLVSAVVLAYAIAIFD
jgi:hypothetical protein